MSAIQLAVTVALVGAGIFIYDMARGEARVPSPVELPPAVSSSPDREPRVREEQAPAIALPGAVVTQAEVDGMRRRIQELEKTVATMRLAAKPVAAGSEGPAPAYRVPYVGDPDAPQYSEQEFAAFRALYEAAQRHQQQEQKALQLGSHLDRIGVSMSPDQREAVLTATLMYESKFRDAQRQMHGQGQVDHQQLQEVRASYHDQLSQRIHQVLPAEDAAKVMSQIGKAAGLGPGRGAEQIRRGSTLQRR